MNLASRCTSCGTLFRIARDQLWMSDGRVRCGQCGSTFNAFDQLYDLEKGKPPPWALDGTGVDGGIKTAGPLQVGPTAQGEGAIGTTQSEPTSAAAAPVTEALGAGGKPALGSAAARASGVEFAETAEGAPWDSAARRAEVRTLGVLVDEVALAASAVSRVEAMRVDEASRLAAEATDGTASAAPGWSTTTAPGTRFGAADEQRPGLLPTPDFVRRAERQARWHHPRIRGVLAGLAVLLAGSLLLQTSVHFRDRLAAGSPSAQRALGWLCAKLGCSIGPPRRITDVTVESSALARVVGEPNLIRLSLTLRNRGSGIVAMPAIDLSLTDGSGKLVARRTLQPADLKAAPAALAPSVDMPLLLVFSTQGQRVAGYTLEIFYP